MVEERTDIPGIPEITELKGGDVRRYSTGNTGAPNSSVMIHSRYLRSSTGSCHDFCKYGKHAVETKARKSMLKKTSIQGVSLGLATIQETVTSAGRNKKSAMGLKSSPDSKTQRHENPVCIKKEVSSVTKKVTVSSNQVSSPLKEIDVSMKQAGDPKLKPVQSKPTSKATPGYLNGTRNSENRKTKEMVALSMNSARVSDSRRKSKIGKSKELRTSERGEKKLWVPLSVASSPKCSVKRVSIMNAKNSENLTGISESKNQSNARKTKPEQSSGEDVPEKTLYIVESSAVNKTVRPIQNVSHSSYLSPSYFSSPEGKHLKHAQNGTRAGRSPPSVEKKNLRRTQNGIPAALSLPSLSSSSKNKGLRCSQYGTHIARSPPFSLSPPSAHSRASSEHDETETENQMMNLKVETKNRAKKGGIMSPRNKDSLARKLKFRRGKVVELQPEVSAPRRLKFRRWVPVDNGSGKVDAGRRSFGKKEGDNGEVGGNRIQSNSSKKFVLRHRDVEGKKDAKSLLNNVIEETASKLVMTRKSKVKALVGAFETVISLQDRKPLVKSTVH